MMNMSRTGLWLVGAHGGVATTVAVGLAALQDKNNFGCSHLACGLVSQLPQFRSLDLVGWDQVVVGGHDIRQTTSLKEAQGLSSGTVPAIAPMLVEASRGFLKEFESRIRPGILFNAGSTIESLSSKDRVAAVDTPRQAIACVQKDLSEFITSSGCDRVVVVHIASTEPPPVIIEPLPESWSQFQGLLDHHDGPLPSSTLYAIAALEMGLPFVNFTPSLGSCPAAVQDLAVRKKTCHMGCDGKTGETFLKSVLAPAFAKRNLEIMSWVGHNIFGNMDGQVLNDPLNKQTKVASKDRLLRQMLGYDPQTHISIEYIKSLGDWKTAWDHIHFRAFLGTPMTLQFTWQGCDSILAAPLVLDLFRFTELASRRGETGCLTQFSSFFKSPLGTDENDFAVQFNQLTQWASSL
jgi:myo-inositol-1-phosphate synthase